MRRAGALVLPARATAGALGGHPLEGEVESIADRDGDEDDQDHPGEHHRNPAGGAPFAPPASEPASSRHRSILHRGAGRGYARVNFGDRKGVA